MLPSRRGHLLTEDRASRTRIDRSIIAETGIIPAGLQLIRDSHPFEVIDTIKEDRNGDHIMRVSGLIQNGDTENANQRYYSTKDILIPAVRAIQEDISNRAVPGEYDHPCSNERFNVLTPDGWKFFDDVKIGDLVYSRLNGVMVESKVTGIVNRPYSGPVYRFKGRHIDSAFTVGHKIILDSRNDGVYQRTQYEVKVRDIIANRHKYNKSIIPRVAEWIGQDDSTYEIPGLPNCAGIMGSPIIFDTKVFVAFLGLWLAEGSVYRGLRKRYEVSISQKPGEKLDQIIELFQKLPVELKWSIYYPKDRDIAIIRFSDHRLHRYLSALGRVDTKFIPKDVKSLDKPYLEELIHWFRFGDGRYLHGRNNVFSISKRLIDDLHECHVKCGGCCYEMTIEPKCDYEFAGRTILAVKKKVLYQLTLSQTTGIYMDDRFLDIIEEQHNGRIYCLTTEHGNFYMQQNGCSFWTGNSDAKIHLDRLSHLMTKVWLDNKKVFGEAEVLHKLPLGACLRGLFEHKVRVGISSRGVGDMEVMEHNGHDVYRVMPGYAFVTWDVVAEPSVHGAVLNIIEGLVKRLRPIKKQQHLFSESAYQAKLVAEINDFFGLDRRKSFPVRGTGRRN